jgi:hypothetical protein
MHGTCQDCGTTTCQSLNGGTTWCSAVWREINRYATRQQRADASEDTDGTEDYNDFCSRGK